MNTLRPLCLLGFNSSREEKKKGRKFVKNIDRIIGQSHAVLFMGRRQKNKVGDLEKLGSVFFFLRKCLVARKLNKLRSLYHMVDYRNTFSNY